MNNKTLPYSPTKVTTKDRPSASRQNALDSVVSAVTNSMFAMGLADSNGFVTRRNIASNSVSGGGGISVQWAEITQNPSYPDPAALSTSPEYAGRAYYMCRLVSSEYLPWDAVTPYIIDDMITYSDKLYKALRNNLNCNPATSADDWEEVPEIKIEYAVGSENIPAKINDCVPWFEIGEIVPLISRAVDGVGTRYYLWQTLTNAGTREQATLRYNPDPDKKITQAVFK